METSLLLYLVFLKLFYLLYSELLVFPLVSCLQNLHFAMIINHPTFGFFQFILTVSITDKPVNRSIHDYSPT